MWFPQLPRRLLPRMRFYVVTAPTHSCRACRYLTLESRASLVNKLDIFNRLNYEWQTAIDGSTRLDNSSNDGFRAPQAHSHQMGRLSVSARVCGTLAPARGSAAIPAAFSHAFVLGIDIAPGMVELLSQRLAPFPAAQARIMDGYALEIEDTSFDTVLSIFRVVFIPDWRKGLCEQFRSFAGRQRLVATWRRPPGVKLSLS